jgi:hypothetical protein
MNRTFGVSSLSKKMGLTLALFMLSATLAGTASAQSSVSPAKPVASSDGQRSFDLMKTLAGTWKGPITTDNPAWGTDQLMPLSIRVASHGNALIHELSTPGPEVTVFYLDDDRLTLLHYCDFGNRPHMVARPSADGKTLEFDLVDAPGSNQVGHVSHALFTIIDANHHLEDWTFMLQSRRRPRRAHHRPPAGG